jgi:Methyltransferase domain
MTKVLDLYAYAVEKIGARSLATSCKVCDGDAKIFDVLDFNRTCNLAAYAEGLVGVPVYYYKCICCGMIFTRFFDDFDGAAWSAHVYNDDYARIDPEFDGARASRDVNIVRSAIDSWWKDGNIGCDFGGGKGRLAAQLRAQGLRFDSVDPFGVDYVTATEGDYDLVSAFEVVEHFPSPCESFAKLAALAKDRCSMLLISTSSVPERLKPGELIQWWYAAPRNGHISLYAPKTLEYLASANGLKYKRVTDSVHVFGRDLDLSRVSRSILLKKVTQRLRRVWAAGA